MNSISQLVENIFQSELFQLMSSHTGILAQCVFLMLLSFLLLRRSDKLIESSKENAELKAEIKKLSLKLKEVSLKLEKKYEDAKNKEKEQEVVPNKLSQEKPAIELFQSESDTPVSWEAGLQKSRNKLLESFKKIFKSAPEGDQKLLTSLEEALISCDIGVKSSEYLIAKLKERISQEPTTKTSEYLPILSEIASEILKSENSPKIEVSKFNTDEPVVVLMVGVNGAGKTTSIAKLANRLKQEGNKVLLAACDTFRAAAVEQLKTWSTRTGVDIVFGSNEAKPSTIAYQAVEKAKNEKYDVLLVDTAGRLHTKSNLMKELGSIKTTIQKLHPEAPHETILVVDGTSGQNALEQAKRFNETLPLSGVIITKLDGTPKGGVVISIKKQTGVDIRYIGIGEGVEDLREFDAKEFSKALISGRIEAIASENESEILNESKNEASVQEQDSDQIQKKSVRRQVNRKRMRR